MRKFLIRRVIRKNLNLSIYALSNTKLVGISSVSLCLMCPRNIWWIFYFLFIIIKNIKENNNYYFILFTFKTPKFGPVKISPSNYQCVVCPAYLIKYKKKIFFFINFTLGKFYRGREGYTSFFKFISLD